MERKSNELSAMYSDCIAQTKDEIKRLLKANDNKVMFGEDNDVSIIGIYRNSGECEMMWCSGVELDKEIKVILNTNEYLDGEPLSCDWLDILEEIENTLEYQQQNK